MQHFLVLGLLFSAARTTFLALVLLACVACSRGSPEQALRLQVDVMQAAMEARDAGDVHALLAEDFVGQVPVPAVQLRGVDAAIARREARCMARHHDGVPVSSSRPQECSFESSPQPGHPRLHRRLQRLRHRMRQLLQPHGGQGEPQRLPHVLHRLRGAVSPVRGCDGPQQPVREGTLRTLRKSLRLVRRTVRGA